MKRYRVIKDFLACLKDNDVAIFSGEDLNREAFQYDRDGNFYVNSHGLASSLALGIAMNTDKRVFVFTGDGECMLEFGAFAQAAVSRCKNIFYVTFDNGCYQAAGGQPTIFRELSNNMGVMFDLGFLTFNYTPHFKKKIPMSGIISTLTGPSVIIVEVDKGYKKGLKDVNYSRLELRNRIIDFMTNKNLGTSLFVPPIDILK